MSYTIAIAGKGGTGKTTICALIVRFLRENKLGSVLAIDADPNSNLGQMLGMEPDENIGAIIDEVGKNIDKVPGGMTKDRYIDYRVQSAIEESDGLDLLSMGRPEGPGCYCYANNVLRGLIAKISAGYDFVVIDNEAGLEHLSRRTARYADCLFIISDTTPIGLNSSQRIYELVKELNIDIKKFVLVINRAPKDKQKMDMDKKFVQMGIDNIEFVPYDTEIIEFSASGKSLMELTKGSSALKSVSDMMGSLTKEKICR